MIVVPTCPVDSDGTETSWSNVLLLLCRIGDTYSGAAYSNYRVEKRNNGITIIRGGQIPAEDRSPQPGFPILNAILKMKSGSKRIPIPMIYVS